MGLLAFIVLGLLIGSVVGYKMPMAPGGTLLTAVIGLVGALVGGIAAAALVGMNALTQFWSLGAWVGAVAGAVVILALYALVASPGPHPEEATGTGDKTTGRSTA